VGEPISFRKFRVATRATYTYGPLDRLPGPCGAGRSRGCRCTLYVCVVPGPLVHGPLRAMGSFCTTGIAAGSRQSAVGSRSRQSDRGAVGVGSVRIRYSRYFTFTSAFTCSPQARPAPSSQSADSRQAVLPAAQTSKAKGPWPRYQMMQELQDMSATVQRSEARRRARPAEERAEKREEAHPTSTKRCWALQTEQVASR
jgi:hypothetical protein